MCAKLVEDLSKELKQDGYRLTRQRQIVFEELRNQESHPRAIEVYNAVRGRLPNVSLGTVYRSLGVLADLGLIRRLDSGKYSRFEANLDNHYHLICSGCEQIFDIHPSILKEFNARELEAKGFKINGHKLELYGLCPNCGNQTESQ